MIVKARERQKKFEAHQILIGILRASMRGKSVIGEPLRKRSRHLYLHRARMLVFAELAAKEMGAEP